MSELTCEKIIKFTGDNISLTRTDLETLINTPFHDCVILIGIQSRKELHIFSVESGKPIFKLNAKMVQEFGKIAFNINSIMMAAKFKYIYSTGFCIKVSHCIHESYWVPETPRPIPPAEIEAINKEIKALEGIIHSEIIPVWTG